MKPPAWIPPMLATLTDKPFSSKDWIFEPKLDGIRCLAYKDGRSVRMYSRNKISLDARYPEIHRVLCSQKSDFIVDGEIVAFKNGLTNFSELQRRAQITNPERTGPADVPVYLYLFDILHWKQKDLRTLPVLERKSVLKKAVVFNDTVFYVTHREKDGELFYREACRMGWEGIIAKRKQSSYISRRSTDWLKFKCVAEQEFVIGGFTDPEGSRSSFGALLLGYWNEGKFTYAGKVGSGYSDQTLQDLGKKLKALQQPKPAYTAGDWPRSRNVHWVRPKLVAQVTFTEWTPDGRLRHPVFRGLRFDKPAESVSREKKAV
jgi:bifunctional non-homologous end joining protein LigD